MPYWLSGKEPPFATAVVVALVAWSVQQIYVNQVEREALVYSTSFQLADKSPHQHRVGLWTLQLKSHAKRAVATDLKVTITLNERCTQEYLDTSLLNLTCGSPKESPFMTSNSTRMTADSAKKNMYHCKFDAIFPGEIVGVSATVSTMSRRPWECVDFKFKPRASIRENPDHDDDVPLKSDASEYLLITTEPLLGSFVYNHIDGILLIIVLIGIILLLWMIKRMGNS